jgi:predicted SprT family Zn-dependent metalloprotease
MNNSSPMNFGRTTEIGPVVSRLCELWGIESIEDEITIEFSSRLTRSLGRTEPTKKIVRLNPDLLASLSKHLEEVLCHEIAHIATVQKYGESPLPHGKEWQSLVRQAGFEPSTRMYVSSGKPRRLLIKRFRHKCLTCFTERIAKTRMNRWRCSGCVKNGMDGELMIEEVL